MVDRYSNWPIIEQAQARSKGLIDSLGCIFGTFGIPDECVTDCGPELPHVSSSRTGSISPPVICSPPTLKLQSINWHQNCPVKKLITNKTDMAVYALLPYNAPYSNTGIPLILPQSSYLPSVYLADLSRTSFTHTSQPLHTSPILE